MPTQRIAVRIPRNQTDPDAQAFITAAGITDTTQKSAINTLVTNLKSYGIWTKMKALYPFVSDNRNLLSYTQDFSNAYWLKYNTSIATNVVNAPDGTLTADELNEGATSNYHGFKTTINGLSPNVTWGASLSLKYNNRRYVSIGWYINASPYPAFGATIDTLNKTIVSSSNTLTASIELQSNDWFRVKLTGNIGNYTNDYTFQVAMLDDSLNQIYLGTNKSVYVWGSQIEIGTSVTSYQAITFTPQSFMAAQHKFNLKDPRDLDAAFRLVFNGGWTHSANGATPNGTNGYANTFYLPSTQASQNNHHVSAYSRTNNTNFFGLIGAANNNIESARSALFAKADSNTWQSLNSNGYLQWSDSNSLGHYISNRTASNVMSGWKDGVKKGTQTSASITPATNNYFIGAISIGAIYGTASFYSNRQTSFASIGDGLTDAEAANFYTAVQAFQTTLGRSIGTQTVSDADAQAFIDAAQITDQVEANAVNNLVIGLKADGLWTKMKAVYPMVGGSNTSTSYNLRNTAQYRISWAGGVTSSANGVTFGVNGYGNTGLNPTTALTLNDTHLSFYSRTDGAGGIDIGATSASDVRNLFIAQSYVGNFYADSYSSAARFQLTVQTKGLMTISRTASNSFKAFKNATQIGTTITSQNVLGTLPNWNIFIGATNRDGAPTNPTAYSARNQAFASIGDGLTDAEALNLNTRVQAFQTTLGRQV